VQSLTQLNFLMGQKLRTLLPLTDKQLIPKWNYLPEVKNVNKQFKDKQKENYDRRHCVTEMSLIPDDSEV